MTTRLWDDDDRLLGDLATALKPSSEFADRLRRAAEAAWSWRRIDEELEFASLVHDSLLDARVGLRGIDPDTYRTVLFEGASASVQLERAGAVVVGQVIPPEPGRLTVEAASGDRLDIEVDDVGCFSLDDVPDGPIRLRWHAPPVNLVTDWIGL